MSKLTGSGPAHVETAMSWPILPHLGHTQGGLC